MKGGAVTAWPPGQVAERPVDGYFPAGPVTAVPGSWDAESLARLAGEVDRFAFTLESHHPQILARLRPDADPHALLAQFESAVATARECARAVEVEIPLATENASTLPETVAWAGREGVAAMRVVPFRARDAAGRAIDALACLSERYLARLERLCVQAADGMGIPLTWEPRAGRTFGLASPPGMCEEAWARVRIDVDGVVEPCMYAERGELTLGEVRAAASLREIWDGPSARDLRRAHLTGDYPAACATCPRTLGPGEADAIRLGAALGQAVVGEGEVREALTVVTPGPLSRLGRAPHLCVGRPDRPIGEWRVAIAEGGDGARVQAVGVSGGAAGARTVRLEFPAEVWGELEANVGHWWAAFGKCEDGSWVAMTAARCMVRHRPVPRVAGSSLRYPDGGVNAGFEAVPRATGFVPPRDYAALVERIRAAVQGALPAGAVCVVATKGDQSLLALGGVVGWHFPRLDDGRYAGFNPPDGRWAVDQLERLRAAGAEYLVLPAPAFWWREYYPELAGWLRSRELVLEERDTCLIVALGPVDEAIAEPA